MKSNVGVIYVPGTTTLGGPGTGQRVWQGVRSVGLFCNRQKKRYWHSAKKLCHIKGQNIWVVRFPKRKAALRKSENGKTIVR